MFFNKKYELLKRIMLKFRSIMVYSSTIDDTNVNMDQPISIFYLVYVQLVCCVLSLIMWLFTHIQCLLVILITLQCVHTATYIYTINNYEQSQHAVNIIVTVNYIESVGQQSTPQQHLFLSKSMGRGANGTYYAQKTICTYL